MKHPRQTPKTDKTMDAVNTTLNPQEFIDWLYGPDGGGSAERPYLFLRWACKIPFLEGRIFWEALQDVWSGFDRIPHQDFSFAFRHFKILAPREGIPTKAIIYRGQSKRAPLGLSWTTCRDVAASFAEGHRGIKNPEPVIYSMEVTAKQIAFVTNDREESEIVLFSIPRKTAKRLTVEPLDLQI